MGNFYYTSLLCNHEFHGSDLRFCVQGADFSHHDQSASRLQPASQSLDIVGSYLGLQVPSLMSGALPARPLYAYMSLCRCRYLYFTSFTYY